MTAGERLVALSGGGSIPAGARLASLAAGANAGARLRARSGLGPSAASVHLMYDPPTAPGGMPANVGLLVNTGFLMMRGAM